ncbi:MAG: NAD(P)-dependent oxidoreductase [Thermoleophilaceae bacterium]
MAESENSTIAVLGTGTMGAPMARNLVSAGFAVRAWNRTRDKADAVEGVEVAESPEEAASGADAVITMLADASAVEEAMTGGGGALPAIGGAPWIQMSTIGLAGTERMKATAAEHEVAFVDAPVLGTREPAEQAQLLVLASGPEDDDLRGRCEPLFDAVGQKTLWVGQAGAGSRLKVVLNSWLLTLVEGVAEAVALASSIGVDPERFLEAIEGGPLGVPYADLKGRAMIADEFPPSFALSLARKDADLVLEAAADLELPFARAAGEQLRRAEAAGHGDDDLAAVVRVLGPDRGATRAGTA